MIKAVFRTAIGHCQQAFPFLNSRIETSEECEICSKLTIKTPERRQ